mmetsp:Transcript_109013/g.316865  ORF Transcript_109013/g.316865 Transcript_109013/m.316865 type:complete len:348 (+) Transcript_109013:94-1137(+)
MRPVPKSESERRSKPDDHGLPRTAVASGTVVGSGTMAAWAGNDTMGFYLPALGGGMPTFGPREWLSDETVREILEALGIEILEALTMHDMIEVTALGENSAGITQEQYAVLTNDPGAFFDWFERHHGDECVHATAAPRIRLRPSTCRLDAITVVTDPVDYDPRFMALALPSKTRIKQWNSLCHAMMRRHEIERELQENFEDLAPLKMKFDEGIIPWIRERGGRFDGLPSRSRHLHNDFFARALTYMDGEFLMGLLPHPRWLHHSQRLHWSTATVPWPEACWSTEPMVRSPGPCTAYSRTCATRPSTSLAAGSRENWPCSTTFSAPPCADTLALRSTSRSSPALKAVR